MRRANGAIVSRSDVRCRLASFVSGLAALVAVLAIPVSSAQATLATDSVPYMGWNAYHGVGGTFNEATIKSVASSLISSGLAQAGYRIVWLDFGWATGARDSNRNLIVDSAQWPHGMSRLSSWLHARGLYAGIYTDAGTSGCGGGGVGSHGHYQQDVDQFAKWGFDAIKVDFCGAGQEWLDQPPNHPRALYGQFSQAVAAAPRAGTTVALSATPALGSKFAGWSGACPGTPSCTVTTNADQTVIATLTLLARIPRSPARTSRAGSARRRSSSKRSALAHGFRCALVKQPKRDHKQPRPSDRLCRSPKSYTALMPDRYTFLVRAFNVGGSDPMPATRRFTID